MNPSSPLATGVQGSAVPTSQPYVAVDLEPKVEVKREIQPDGETEDGGHGFSSCAASSLLALCMSNATAGNAPLVCLVLLKFSFLLLGWLLCKNLYLNLSFSV